ncbi:hypothetical protein KQH61_03885 [bacterium]|nr:hypothetical protein [bacterium]MCB2179043.1 hypothetical protein [bacterium]
MFYRLFTTRPTSKAAWENFLVQNGIAYPTVWHEDLAKNFVQEMSHFYVFPNIGREEVPAPVIQKFANTSSQEWLSQFRAETTWLKDPIIAESLAAGDFPTAYIYRSMRLITAKEERAWKAMPSNRFIPLRKLMLRLRRKLTSWLKK